MLVAWQTCVALAPLFAVWSVVCATVGIRRSRADLVSSAFRGLAAAVACAAVATCALAWSLATHDLSVAFVARHSSVLMPARYALAALVSGSGGALLGWSALVGITGLASVVSLGRSPERNNGAATWLVAILGAAIAPALIIVAMAANPFSAGFVQPAEGAGLAPDMQRGAAAAHGLALLVGAALATVAFAATAAAIAARRLDAAWNRQVRVLDLLAWTALFIGAVAGARWAVVNPARAPWLQNPTTSLWLLPAAIGAWLVHLDAARATAERIVTRVILIAATFVTAGAALALQSGVFLSGVHTIPDSVGAWFGVVPAAGLLILIALLRRGRGVLGEGHAVEESVPHRVGGWLSHAGIVLVAGAAIGSGFTREHVVALGDAEIFRTRDPFRHQWSFASQGVSTLKRENFASLTVSVIPERDGVRGEMLSAEARSYLLADASEPGPVVLTAGLRSGGFTETRLTIVEPDGRRPTVRVTFVPLAPWLVAGTWLVAIGAVLSVTRPQRGAS